MLNKFETAERGTGVCVEERGVGRAEDNELGFQHVY